MVTLFTLILYVNLLLFAGVFIYTIVWSLMAIRAATWKSIDRRVVTRTDQPRLFWLGIGMVLTLGATGCGAAALAVLFRKLILGFLGVSI
jgi:hypothetical protein